MFNLSCHICGESYESYGDDPFIKHKSDGVAVRIFNKQRGRFEVKHYWTCRGCATMIQAHIDKMARDNKEEI
jgi:hypothetical protein